MPITEELIRYIDTQGRNEIASYTPIQNLFLLVHPLNEEYGKGILCNNHTRRTRMHFSEAVKKYFVPQDPKDVLVIVPNVQPTLREFRKKVLATQIQMELFNDPNSWITLHEFAENNAVSRKNVMLGENVPEISIPSETIEERLRGRGFSISSQTNIIIGGELIENCIADTAMDFLSLAQVESVRIDRYVALGISDYAKHGPIPQTSVLTSAERLTVFGYDVLPEPNRRYIRVSHLS